MLVSFKINVRKHKKLIPDYLCGSVVKVINMMHNCRNLKQFNKLKSSYVDKWFTSDNMKEFGVYFSKQSIDSRWNKWHLFNRNCELSITNSLIESYNNQIKTEFTGHEYYHLVPAFEKFNSLPEKTLILNTRTRQNKKIVNILVEDEDFNTSLLNKILASTQRMIGLFSLIFVHFSNDFFRAFFNFFMCY